MILQTRKEPMGHRTLSEGAVRRRAPFATYLTGDQEWYTPKEVAAILGKTDQYVRDCFLNQKILGHTTNGRTPRGQERRQRYQIHRDSVLLYLCETANYTPEDYVDRLEVLLDRVAPEQRERLATRLLRR
ncbi:MAG: hypothetical protein ACFBZ8_13820 [Opitutales bacterium]